MMVVDVEQSVKRKYGTELWEDDNLAEKLQVVGLE